MDIVYYFMVENANSSLCRGLSGIAGAGLAAKLLGYARDALLVAFFGGGVLADAYYAAFRLVNIFRRTVGEGALNAVFIPLLEKEKLRGPAAARAFFASAWTVIFCGSAMLCAAGIIFSRQLVTLAAWGFKDVPGQLALTALLAAILMPHLLFVNTAALFTAALNSARKFLLPALAPALFSICVIGVLLFFHAGFFSGLDARGKIMLVAAAAAASGLLQALALLPSLRREGYSLEFANPLKNLGAAPALLAAAPAAITLAQDQLSLLINTAYASFLAPGSITAIYNSARLVQFPVSLFAAAAATLALPELAARAAVGDAQGFRDRLKPALAAAWLIMLPAALGLAITALPVCRALFEHGNFSAQQSAVTARALAWLALGLPAYGINKVAAAALYAMGRQKAPITITSAQLLLNALLALPLMSPMGVGGLMLATSLSSWAAALAFLHTLKRQAGFSPLSLPLFRPAVAAAVSGLAALGLREMLAPADPLAVTAAAVPAAVIIYFLILIALKVEERALITGGKF
ncbi:MAG: murein biosynthesis integral membrane protein MurJ [Elusimicrobia bacterium RIFOXYA2_FULL_58_8]|nr:MAG: murein biosynthesis integral membrane protein MurJ [Elusimicrobia bacterium RIFOXYA12_FULL_57_11]OGS13289.1 MAG: murein biosynthesis integral membrane protein MurJ [Elusimicrobia bacterium RIFOXYA2_FULL_58_8]